MSRKTISCEECGQALPVGYRRFCPAHSKQKNFKIKWKREEHGYHVVRAKNYKEATRKWEEDAGMYIMTGKSWDGDIERDFSGEKFPKEHKCICACGNEHMTAFSV